MDGWRHMKPDAAMRTLLLGPGDPAKAAPLANMLYIHGVKACLEFNKSGDLQKAKALSNPELAPHLNFLDLEGHGYALVTTARARAGLRIRLHSQPLSAHRCGRWRRRALPRAAHRAVVAAGRDARACTRRCWKARRPSSV